MTYDHVATQDATPFVVRGLIKDALNEHSQAPVKVLLEHVHVPAGEHPTPATASFVITLERLVLTAQMLFAIVGSDNLVRSSVSSLCVQRRTSRGLLTYPSDLSRVQEVLAQEVRQLIEREFGDRTATLQGLRRLRDELASK